MKPTFFDAWPNYIFRRSSKGELVSVVWESKYEQLRRFENHCGVESRGNPPKAWTRMDRRNPLCCEICLQRFSGQIALARHLPCRKNQQRISPGFVDLVMQARNRSVLYTEEVNYFRNVLSGSLSGNAFQRAWKRRNVDFFQRSEDKAENFKQFRVEWFLCFLSYIRPDERLNPRAPGRHEWRLSEAIEEKFVSSGEPEKAMLIRLLFDRKTLLEDIAKQKRAGRPPILLSPTDKEAFRETVRLHGTDAADRLTWMKVKLDDGRTPLQLYKESCAKFANWLRDQRRASGIKPRPYRRDSA